MPTLQLYGRDVRFHISQTNIFSLNNATFRNHPAWSRITPKVWFRVAESGANDFPTDWNNVANNFAAAGLTGTLGETNAASWQFVAGATEHNIGRAVAYTIDMYNRYYASRGISHDGRYAWWPGNAAQAGYNDRSFSDHARQWALFPHLNSGNPNIVYGNGSTSDYIQISSWTGSTASQLSVQANTPFVEAGLSAFTEWVRRVVGGITAAQAVRPGLAAPKWLAGDWEQTPSNDSRRVWFNNGINGEEMGSWQQMLNDPRATTYRFFDRYTLYDLWGATGTSSQWGRSPFQWSIPFTITAANNAAHAVSVPSRPVDVIWERRTQALDYTPSFYNFYSTLVQRHREHLWARSFAPYRNAFADSVVGNYQNIPSTRIFPNRDPGGKIHAYTYTCDIGCTGPSGATFGYNDASVTGTFSLDYAAPVIYPAVPASDQKNVSNFLPGIGYFFINYNYSGAWGSSTPVAISGPGIFSLVGGLPLATYQNFLQHCSKQGMTGIAGGGTAEGYTGGNITDLRNYFFANAKQLLDTSRNALDSFNDNTSKPVIPWIGNANGSTLYHSIFSLTASSSSPYFADANGITNWALTPFDAASLDYNVAIVKYAIQTHGIEDFFIFEPNGLFSATPELGIAALDFWNDVVETLELDSNGGNTAPVARINVLPGTDVIDAQGDGETFTVSGLSSSDSDGDALDYAWTTSTGLSAVGPTASFVFNIGTRTVSLKVTDTNGATGATSTTIIVRANTAPVARINVLPSNDVRDTDGNGTETLVLSGLSSSDSNDQVQQYLWNIAGATVTGPTTSYAFPIGITTVGLMVIDTYGATSATSTSITVRSNTTPTAIIDVTPSTTLVDNDGNGVETFYFDGSRSSDAYGGTVVGYNWYVDGVLNATGISTSVGLTVGTHAIALVVFDNGGLSANDSTNVIVQAQPIVEPLYPRSEFASMIVYGGKIYTREQFEYLLKKFYGKRSR